MNFLLAELLFESGDYQQAAQEYEITAYDYVPHENAAAAGYAAVLAYDKQEQASDGQRTTGMAPAIDRTRHPLCQHLPAASAGHGRPHPQQRTAARQW